MRLCCCCVCIAVAVANTTDVVDVDALFVDDEDDVNQLSSFLFLVLMMKLYY